MRRAIRNLPASQVLLGALCTGIAAANLARLHGAGPAGLAVGSSMLAALTVPGQRLVLVALALVLAGWWWGSARLDAIDRSPLTRCSARPSRRGSSSPRRRGVRASPSASRPQLQRFGDLAVSEPILLELPAGRAPAQGAVLDVLGVLAPPHGPEHGFDERTWLRRHGVHVVLRGDRWRVIGHRGGLGGVADRLRAFVTRGLSRGSGGEHRAVLLGVVLGADEGLSQSLRDRFRASGLYHLLAVSGRTSRSSPRARSWSRGWPASRASSASSERWPRSPPTSSPSGRNRLSSARGSPARSARSRGCSPASAIAGGSCSSARSSCSPGIPTRCSTPASSSPSPP